jgi:hypothetical protein
LTPVQRRQGLPIGNVSQLFANIGLDHFCTEVPRPKGYLRSSMISRCSMTTGK